MADKQDRGQYTDYMQTYLGNRVWPLQPHPDDIDIEDIANSLGKLCRFNGHCKQFYSVAQHSVHVSEIVPPEDAKWGLLHDASEAYLSDLITPLKKYFTDYQEYESNMMKCIAIKYGLPPEMPESVKIADLQMLILEKEQLMEKCNYEWKLPDVPRVHMNIVPYIPEIAIDHFLSRFVFLFKDTIRGQIQHNPSLFSLGKRQEWPI